MRKFSTLPQRVPALQQGISCAVPAPARKESVKPAVTPPFSRSGWLIACGLAGVLLLLAAAAPILGPGWRGALMTGFSLACHQIHERSFELAGVPMAVCHRCTGVFAGLLAGALALPAVGLRSPRIGDAALVALALVPIGLDWGLDAAGLVSNVPLSRVLTGAAFGLVAGWLFARALAAPAPALAGIRPDA
jgi:uncharacterized membrane protein